jgi:formate dehydrogenase subunit gamma
MQTGYCDENWAKEHHDLWYEQVKNSGETKQQDQAQTSMASRQSESTEPAS